MSLVLLLSSAFAARASATLLPSFPVLGAASTHEVVAAEHGAKWWAQVGDRVYHSPASQSGLSERIGAYYYAVGSGAALTEELKDHRVGGQGRLHIFHFPEGKSMLQDGQRVGSGSRRASLSRLKRLKNGMALSTKFPVYSVQGDPYINPLDANSQVLEKAVVAQISADLVMSYLTKITNLPGNSSAPTRSDHNPVASAAVQAFLKEEFEGMGLTVCPLAFHSNGIDLSNIIAYIPGLTQETITVGAHYDSIPAYGKAPGAEDNGSGLAALLAMAKSFALNKVAPVRTVYFVAFAGEESGLLGSDAFAKELSMWGSLIEDKCKPVSLRSSSFLQSYRRTGVGNSWIEQEPTPRNEHQAIVMDEIGWLSPALDGPTVNLESYDWTTSMMDHLHQSCKTHNGDSLIIVHSNSPFGSDHMSFLDRQMPAVLTINGDDESYPDYHKSSDRISNVDGEYMAKIAKMNMGALIRIAGVREGTVQTA